MRAPDSYEAFALVYDRGLGKLFFDGVRPVLDRLDREYPSESRTHLDLACGTGLVVGYFKGKGFSSFGLDSSLSMLAVAQRRNDEVFAADFRHFGLGRSFDRVTCLYDSLNHVMDEEDLAHVFAATREVMTAESLFWFDLNHPSTYAQVWAIADPYHAGGGDWALSIDTRYDESRNLAVARVTGTCVVEGADVEVDETHHQRAWEDEDVRRILAAEDLDVIDVFRFNPFGFGGNSDATVKRMYVVRRR